MYIRITYHIYVYVYIYIYILCAANLPCCVAVRSNNRQLRVQTSKSVRLKPASGWNNIFISIYLSISLSFSLYVYIYIYIYIYTHACSYMCEYIVNSYYVISYDAGRLVGGSLLLHQGGDLAESACVVSGPNSLDSATRNRNNKQDQALALEGPR